MQRYKITAAVAAILCASVPVAVHAETNPEIFSPSGTSLVYNDGSNVITGSFSGLGYEVIQGHAVAEGDIVLGQVNGDGLVLRNGKRGLGQSRILDRWTNGIIPYQFSTQISTQERQLALAAVAHWNQYTSLSLVEITPESQTNAENYITFEASNSCASYVGMRGGNQQLWISESCGVGSIIHEIGHAVGLFHEHTRNDRDNYIDVSLENIVAGKEFNFDVLNSSSTLLGEYDYGSIMHYGETFFSTNGLNTIEVFGDAEIGQRIALSDKDIKSVNAMYETDLSLMVNSNLIAAEGLITNNIQVTNQGQIGANKLSLMIDAGGNATWYSMSPNSGWECSADGTKLFCDRETLDASATSLLTVVATANGTAASALSAELIANTRESSYDNNGYNATVRAPALLSAQTTENNDPTETGGSNGTSLPETVPTSPVVQAPSVQTPQQVSQLDNETPEQALPETVSGTAAQLSPAQESSEPLTPVLAAATPTSPASSGEGSEKNNTVAEAGGSGGALSPLSALSLLLGMVAIRRRRDPA